MFLFFSFFPHSVTKSTKKKFFFFFFWFFFLKAIYKDANATYYAIVKSNSFRSLCLRDTKVLYTQYFRKSQKEVAQSKLIYSLITDQKVCCVLCCVVCVCVEVCYMKQHQYRFVNICLVALGVFVFFTCSCVVFDVHVCVCVWV